MRQFFLVVLLLTSSLIADSTTQEKYQALIKEFPSLIANKGEASKGEIEILLNPDKMNAVEKSLKRDVGVIAQDCYWTWINDACRFPGGFEGIYGRILWTKGLKNEGPAGVVVMPITPEGKIVLNCNFRHATRSWEIELPRGGLEIGESVESGARREVLEETGRVVKELIHLGELPPDSGLSGMTVPLYGALVDHVEAAQNEATEAIEEILTLSKEEIKQAFVKGSYPMTIRGNQIEVKFRDPFLAYALLIYELKESIPK